MLSLKVLRNLRPQIYFHGIRSLSKCSVLKEKWRLMTAVTLERFPIITQEKNEIETRFQKLLDQIEYENSLLSDHELRHIEDKRLVELRKQDDYEESEAEAIRQTASEAEDLWETEVAAFTPAPRITEADEKNDVKSTERKLDRKLTLLVKQQLGDQTHWMLPQGPRKDGETMRQSAERVLAELCGEEVEAKFIGNAPCGYLKYKFPPSVAQAEGEVGAKVFFYKAQLQSGSVSPQQDAKDHVWATKDEIKDYVSTRYMNDIDDFVLEL